MPDPSIPENTPPPPRPAGRKRGPRPARGTAPPAARPPTPPEKRTPAHPRAQAQETGASPLSPAEVPPAAVEIAEVAAPGDVAEADERAAPVAVGAGVIEAAPADADTPPPAAVASPDAVAAEPEPPAPEPPPPPAPERGLATILGGSPVAGRPTWLDVPPERIGSLLAVFADEGARLLAMTVLPAPESPDAPLTLVDLRYHFVVDATPITVSTRTPRRSAPSAAGPFPAMTWRERELAGEYGLRFVEPAPDVAESGDEGSGVRDQGSVADDRPAAAPIPSLAPGPNPRPPTPDP